MVNTGQMIEMSSKFQNKCACQQGKCECIYDRYIVNGFVILLLVTNFSYKDCIIARPLAVK